MQSETYLFHVFLRIFLLLCSDPAQLLQTSEGGRSTLTGRQIYLCVDAYI